MKNLSLEQKKQKCNDLSLILKSMANPQRLLILCSLIEGEKSVGELTEICNISQPVISNHLSRMHLQGFIDFRKDKNFVYYYIVNNKVLKLMDSLYEIFCKEE